MSRAPESNDYDIRDVFASGQDGSDPGVNLKAQDRLVFARQILFYLFLMCLVVIVGYGFNPESKAWQDMFELVKIGALPLVTLVVGFYFPSSTK